MKARIAIVLAVLLMLSAWSAAIALARGEGFRVTYSGAGTITSRIRTQTSPNCGEVMDTRNETTHFSWVTHYEPPVFIFTGAHGLDGVSANAEAQQSSLASNESTVTLSDTGCQPGIANCKGESDPKPGNRASFDISGAPRGGRARAKVGAVGGFTAFTGKGFSGSWGFPSGSCAIEFNDSPLLLPEFNVPVQLTANFPIKVATLTSLRVGHYFKVRISAGHYAPAHRDNCFPDAGCLKDDFSWHGVVEFKRVS